MVDEPTTSDVCLHISYLSVKAAVSQLSDIDLTPELAIKLVIAGGTDSVKFSVVIYVAVIVVICC